MVVHVTSQVFSIRASGLHAGAASVSLALIPLIEPADHISDVQARRPLTVQRASTHVVPNLATKTVQVMRFTLTK